MGLPSLDPYFVPEIKVDFKSYIADFHAIVSKMDVSGLTKMTLLDARYTHPDLLRPQVPRTLMTEQRNYIG